MDVETASATATLGDWVAGLRWEEVPEHVQQRLRLVLLDVLGVACLGATDPAQQRFVDAWAPSAGPSPVFGAGVHASVEAAAWLNATALVRLELDEGNKYAKGHPAAHGFPAVLALAAAQQAESADVLVSLLAAYEVAARYGRATRLRAGMHPHGSWGVVGAAAGCARLLRLDGEATAGAIDAAAGMPIAGHFSSALDGNRVRDAWMGASNVSGLNAARLAAAGLASNTGTAARSLGELLGAFDPQENDGRSGTRWDVEHGYFKRHAACVLHPPRGRRRAGAAGVRSRARPDDDRRGHRGHPLPGCGPRSSDVGQPALGDVLDSLVVAAALVHGTLGPEASDDHALQDPAVLALAQRVQVRLAPDLDARLPGSGRCESRSRLAGNTSPRNARTQWGTATSTRLTSQPSAQCSRTSLAAPLPWTGSRGWSMGSSPGNASMLDVLAEPVDTEIHAASPPATTPS